MEKIAVIQADFAKLKDLKKVNHFERRLVNYSRKVVLMKKTFEENQTLR